MKIICQHGFYLFDEDYAGEASNFIDLFGLDLVQYGEYFTFKTLADALDYSIKGVEYLGFDAINTFQGKPWDIFRSNNCLYDFNKDEVISKEKFIEQFDLDASGNRFISDGLILAGSITTDGKKVLSYTCFYSSQRSSWLYSGVEYDE